MNHNNSKLRTVPVYFYLILLKIILVHSLLEAFSLVLVNSNKLDGHTFIRPTVTEELNKLCTNCDYFVEEESLCQALFGFSVYKMMKMIFSY